MSLSVKTLQYRVTAGGDYRCVDSRCRCTDTCILPVEATDPMDLSALRTAIESHIVRSNRPETLRPFRMVVMASARYNGVDLWHYQKTLGANEHWQVTPRTPVTIQRGDMVTLVITTHATAS